MSQALKINFQDDWYLTLESRFYGRVRQGKSINKAIDSNELC
jgi:hypothetical protein